MHVFRDNGILNDTQKFESWHFHPLYSEQLNIFSYIFKKDMKTFFKAIQETLLKEYKILWHDRGPYVPFVT